MSRIFTIVVILLLMAVVALVPRIRSEEPGPNLGNGYAYREDTLARFRLLLEDEAWTLSDPPRNAQGMLEAAYGKTGLTFVVIPAGSFLMGSPEEEAVRWRFEGPTQSVNVPAFLLGRTECTQRAWERGAGKNRSKFKGAECPVERLDWTDCHGWCARNGLRLPSEEEWEYACRAGGTGRWCFGNDVTRLSEYAWTWENSKGQTHPAGRKRPNRWGLHDMHGNVYEFCEDWYMEPWLRVMRGGDWVNGGRSCRSAFREGGPAGDTPYWLRFRPSMEDFRGQLGFRPAGELPDVERRDGE